MRISRNIRRRSQNDAGDDNLISNALRYTPEDGTLTLSARKVNDQVDISVADDGEGIQPEEIPYIFDRFPPGG